MYRKKYRVTGEDVDDFMVMQDFAYNSYTLSLLKNFLAEKGYSKEARDQFADKLKNSSKQLKCLKNLMFTQDFFINMDFFDVVDNNEKIKIQNRFFNAQNELCATITINT